MPRVRRKRKASPESAEQKVYMHWLWLQYRELWELAYHPANGGSRGGGDKKSAMLEGKSLKKMGVKAGVSDVVLAYPRGIYHGAYLELKPSPPHKYTVTDSQREWGGKVEARGYYSKLCVGLDAIKAATVEYWEMGEFKCS